MEKCEMEKRHFFLLSMLCRYFSLQATCPLHLGDEVRVAVEMSICCENEDGPQADCFSLPMYHVYTIIEQVSGVHMQ